MSVHFTTFGSQVWNFVILTVLWPQKTTVEFLWKLPGIMMKVCVNLQILKIFVSLGVTSTMLIVRDFQTLRCGGTDHFTACGGNHSETEKPITGFHQKLLSSVIT